MLPRSQVCTFDHQVTRALFSVVGKNSGCARTRDIMIISPCFADSTRDWIWSFSDNLYLWIGLAASRWEDSLEGSKEHLQFLSFLLLFLREDFFLSFSFLYQSSSF